MRLARSLTLPLLGAALLLGACSDPDVGQACKLDLNDSSGKPVDSTTTSGYTCSGDPADYFKPGAIECENLICIRSPVGACPESGTWGPIEVRKYCSKPCVSDSDCFTKETGLVCRTMLLDESFINGLPQEVKDKYLGPLQTSTYCATSASR